MDHLKPGQELDVERLDRGDYRLVRRVGRRNEGLVDWLLACPHKGFFVNIKSEFACETSGGGETMPVKGSLIAATAAARGLSGRTRNRPDFTNAGVYVVDPFAA